MFAFGETITVTQPTVEDGRDVLGNPTVGDPSTVDVDNVGVAPLSPAEATELWGPNSNGGYTLLLPYGTEIPANATVTVRGEAGFQIQGAAGLVQWRSPFTGWEAGAVAVARRAS